MNQSILLLLLALPFAAVLVHSEDILLEWTTNAPVRIYTNSEPRDLKFWRASGDAGSGVWGLGSGTGWINFPPWADRQFFAVRLAASGDPVPARLRDYTLRPRTITLAWDGRNAGNVAGYNLYCGPASRSYNCRIPTGQTQVDFLCEPGRTYFFAVTATNTAGLESDYSDEVSFGVPLVNSPPAIHGSARLNFLQVNVFAVGPHSATDADGDTVTFWVEQPPTNGVLSGPVTGLQYAPAGVAEDWFVLAACDWRHTNRLVFQINPSDDE